MRFPAVRYLLAVLAAVAAAVATTYVPVIAERAVFLFFIFATFQTALWLGLRPAIVVVALSLILANSRFLSQEWYSAPHHTLILNLGFCILTGLIVTSSYLYRRSATRLRESRADLNRAQAVARTGSWRWNARSHDLRLTDEVLRLFGTSKGTLLTREAMFDAVHPEDREHVERLWQAALAGAAYDVDYRVVAGGKVKWLRELAELDFTPDGSVLGGMGIVQDITTRKHAEQALEERLRLQDQMVKVAASVPGVICSFRLRPDGSACMPYASPSFEALYGLRHEDVAEDFGPVFARTHPDDIAHVNASVAQSARTLASWCDTFRYLHPTRGEIWVEGHSVPAVEADGSILWHGYVQDITERVQARAALQAAEADLCRAQAMGNIGCWRLNVRSNELTWSEENHRIFGIPRGVPMSYETFLSCVHPADREYVNRMWQAALGGAPYEIEHRVVANGELKWVREKAELEYDETGALLGGFGITQDITQRKDAERALQESEEKLRSILDAASVIAWDADVQEDRVSSVGPVAKFFDRPEGFDFHGRDDFLGSIHPEDRGRVQADLEAAIHGERPYRIEFRIPLSGGTVRWACAEGEVQYDAKGEPTRVLGITHDITALKLSSHALRESEARLQLAAEVTNLALWECNVANGTVYFSPEWKRLIGYDADELPDRWEEWKSRLHPEDRNEVLSTVDAYLVGKLAHYDLEYRLCHRDGTYRWMHSRGALVYDQQGHPERLLVLNLDISECKKAQKLRERRSEMEELSRFQIASQTAAAIAHELHQPLTAIASYSEVALHLLQAGNPDPNKLTRTLENNVQQSLRAGQVTRQLTALLYRGETVKEPMDLGAAIQEAIAIASENGCPSQFSILVDIAPGLPLVSANRLQVEKVLVNLLANGLEAMQNKGLPAGAVTVSASRAHTNEEPMALVTVRDSGDGFDERTMKSLFQPFYTTKASGLGMGLAISRSLIEANGGKLWTEVDSNRGACFHFTLPFARWAIRPAFVEADEEAVCEAGTDT